MAQDFWSTRRERRFVALIKNPRGSDNIPVLLLVCVMYLLVFTLMPFTLSIDPSIPFARLFIERFGNFSAFWSPHPWDMLSNISLFIPFGFLLAGLPWLSRRKLYAQILVAGGVTFILSSAIELCQIFLPRFPSTSDVLQNTAGGMTGAAIGFFFYAPVALLASQCWVRVQRSRWLPKMWTLYVLVFLTASSMPVYRTDFSNWDPTFRLLLGNEARRSRPWLGKMYMVAIYDRALSPSEIAANYSVGPTYNATKRRIQDGLVAFYDFTEGSGTTIQDRSSFGAPLDLYVRDPDHVKWLSPNGIELVENTIIASPGPADKLYDSDISRQSSLTVEAWVAPADIQQHGPARIVSYSQDWSKRNFTLGQEKGNLIFRLRTPLSGLNGTRPQLQTPDSPLTTGLHHLIVTYHNGRETLFVDGKIHKSMRIDAGRYHALFYSTGRWAFWFVFLFPLGFLSYIVFQRRCVHSRTALLVSALTSLAAFACIEVIQVFIFYREADLPLLTVGVGIILLSILTSTRLSQNVPAA